MLDPLSTFPVVTDLGLVANDADAPWVHEGDDPIGVVPGQELRGDRHAVHVHAHGRAGHLGTSKSTPQSPKAKPDSTAKEQRLLADC